MVTVAYDWQIFAQQQFGGISRYYFELASRLCSSERFRPVVIAPVHQNSYLADANFAVWGCHLPTPRTPLLRRAANPATRIANEVATRALLRIAKPRVVHETYFRKGARLRNTSTVTTVYDMIHERFSSMFPTSDQTSARKRESVERADLVLCISEQTRRDLVEIFNVPHEKTRVTYLASSLMKEPRRDKVSLVGRPYLLYVGARGGYKNFTTLLHSYKQLEKTRADLRIVAFGGGPLSPVEREQIRELGIRDDEVVHCSGDDEDLVALYKGAVALIYPSLYEGFGIPPLEAMEAGCPVICSAEGSLREVVGAAAYIIDPRSVEELTVAIVDVFSSPTTRSLLVTRGREQRGLFSWERCAEETMGAYQELL